MKKTILLLFLLSLIFVFGCSSTNGDNNNYKEYDSQINDIKNELSVLNEKINNLNAEKEESKLYPGCHWQPGLFDGSAIRRGGAVPLP